MGKIPYYTPPLLTPKQREQVERKVAGILGTRRFTKAGWVRDFEADVQLKLGSDYVVITSSGTTALFIAAKAAQEVYGYNNVQIPVYGYVSTAEAFAMAEYDNVVLADVDPNTFLVNPHTIPGDPVITCGIDTFGNYWKPHDDAEFHIADATHSFGTKGVGQNKDGRDIECFSFTGSKIIPAGEGGAITTSDERLYNQMVEIRDWAGRMSEMNAALGIQYLLIVNRILDERKRLALLWRDALPDVLWQTIPTATNYYAIAGIVDDRDHFMAGLPGIEFKTYWSEPQIYLYREFPNAKRIAERIVCFPVTYDDEMINTIKTIKEYDP